MISKYSELDSPRYRIPSRREPRFEFPDEKDPKLASFEAYYAEVQFVIKSRKELLEKKIRDGGGVAKTPVDKHGMFCIVSREPTNPSKWRLTYFEGSEPTGHSLHDGLTTGSDTVFQSLSIDWEAWSDS